MNQQDDKNKNQIEKERNSKKKLNEKSIERPARKRVFKPYLFIREALLLTGGLYALLGIQNIAYPSIFKLLLYDYSFLTYLFFTFGFLNILGSVYYRKFAMAVFNCFMLLFNSLLLSIVFIMLNGIINIPVAIISIVLLAINLMSFVMSFGLLIIKKLRRVIMPSEKYFSRIDMKRKRVKLKTALALVIPFTIVVLGIGSFYNWNVVITVKAPDNFKTTSSYWGPPSLELAEVNTSIDVSDPSVIHVSNDTINATAPGFIPGSFAYVIHVGYENGTMNYCNYSDGARSYPNGTVFLSTNLPNLDNVSIVFKYVKNNKVLQYLNISQSTLIMNFHSSSHPLYPNGYWYYNNNFFESVSRTYLLQVLDYWGIKYYLNVHNGID
ncbi:MAG: hypothetical protein ACTSWN_03400, partial [Promethearchaeota archaeon]